MINVIALYKEQNAKTKAWAWAIGVHVILLLLFLLISYRTPATEPVVQDMGMEVNLGTDPNGSGTDQPMVAEDPAPDRASASYKTSSAQQNEAKELMESNDPDAPSVTPAANNNTQNRNRAEQNNRRTRNNQQQANNNNTTTQQRPRYVYDGGAGRGGNSAANNSPGTNEGNTQGKGDRGVPGGTPGASNYEGVPGSGNGGISHTLSKRNIVAFPPPDADFREGGRVVVRITVNRAGAIVNKQIVSASSGELRAIALRKLDKVKFNKSEEAPEEQFGNITFVFKTRS